jgi:hypothetical protein
MAKPKFNLRARIRIHHGRAQWGTVIERTESTSRETTYLMRPDPADGAVLPNEIYGEAALLASNATEAPRDPFATEQSAPAARKVRSLRKPRR